MSTVKISTSVQPVTVAEAKLHLRIDQDHEDSLITAWIAAATDLCEQRTGRAIALSTYRLRLDTWPGDIRLTWSPVVSVESVRYADPSGVVMTLDAGEYRLDNYSDPAWLLPITEWPEIGDYANAVEVNFTAGYGTSAPEALKTWIMLQVGHWSRNREIATDKPMTALPYADGLLDRWRVY